DFVNPNDERQAECIQLALRRAELEADEISIVNTHATSTATGDIQECKALRRVWGDTGGKTAMNNTKSFIGHAMGAAGALELAGNLPAFADRVCHATINLDNIDPECVLPDIVANQPRELDKVDYILNNSFGMLGINSVVIVGKV
ncbi:MAG: beta-ketoacyl-[acyl-carrier-protein] synthase family protein, partial [Planctomycetota bacterium]|nr:beta-ketoacyl-[acyl-carrier-protein] synthase family protein [Planctomycetota bacterium]